MTIPGAASQEPTTARPPVLVTGATGNVGSAVVRDLVRSGVPVRAATRRGGTTHGVESVVFDFTDATTWARAFAGITTMFLVRPPALSSVKRDLLPALTAARAAGVEHVVLLSLQGADRIPVVPHARIEAWLRGSGMSWTFVRASFFQQNLSTTHAGDIRDRDRLPIPAGRGRTAFVDVLDVAAVAAQALTNPAAHTNRAWTVTGPQALTYAEVAEILSTELGRPIRYTKPGVLAYARHARQVLDMAWPMVLVTSAIYTTARLGLAAGLTSDVHDILGREPIDFRAFAHRERATWAHPAGLPRSPG